MRLFSLGLLTALFVPLAAHAVTIDWVEVGDPGNTCETQSQGCFGAVGSVYRISKYEVTNAQYAEFLNAVADTDTYGLYNTNMGSGYGGIKTTDCPVGDSYCPIAGREDMPVNWVSFYDTLRFANWLHNGQPSGAQDSTTTEDGAYTIIAESYPGGPFITRNADATIFLTSEDEWYKAAYFNGTSYFDYPAGSNAQTGCVVPSGDTGNSANCDFNVGDLTNVGAYSLSGSPYGTFDQGGNLWEWNEAIIGDRRGLRGGGMTNSPGTLAASGRSFLGPNGEGNFVGFRVAMIPEPGTGLLLAFGLAGLAAAGRRRPPRDGATRPSAATPFALRFLLRCTFALVFAAGGAIQSRAATITITATPPLHEVTVSRGEAGDETISYGAFAAGINGNYPNRFFHRAALVFDVSALSGVDPQDIVSISLKVFVADGAGSFFMGHLEAIPLSGPAPGWVHPFQVTTLQPEPGTPCANDPESCPAVLLSDPSDVVYGRYTFEGLAVWKTVDVTDAVAALGDDFLQISFVPVALGVTEFVENQASLTFEVVPEPSTVLLLACGLAGLAAAGRRRQ